MINTPLFLQMKKYNSLKRQIFFEIYSLIGRKFLKKRSHIPTIQEPVLLDLGAGNNFTQNWIHADFFNINNPFKHCLKKKLKSKKPDVQLDLRYPLLCPDNSVDGVYTCHTLEHLLPLDAINLINEIFRILKPNKWLRIIIPDISIAIDYYLHKNNNHDYNSGCEAIMGFTQNWGHLSSWDEEFLSQILYNSGFKNIKKVEYGSEGSDKRLIKDPESRKKVSLVMEAQNPNI